MLSPLSQDIFSGVQARGGAFKGVLNRLEESSHIQTLNLIAANCCQKAQGVLTTSIFTKAL